MSPYMTRTGARLNAISAAARAALQALASLRRQAALACEPYVAPRPAVLFRSTLGRVFTRCAGGGVPSFGTVLCILALALTAGCTNTQPVNYGRIPDFDPASQPRLAGGGTMTEPSVEAMAGQMLLVGFRGTNEADTAAIMEQVRSGQVGGVILFDRDVTTGSKTRNVVSAEQVRRLTANLQAAADIPLFISIDQEGGRVQRLKPEHGFHAHSSAAKLGAGTPAATEQEATVLGAELEGVGINVDFAPVVDLAINPSNPVIAGLGRSFGRSPCLVAEHAAAFINGMARHGIICVLKHFPGHGSSMSDSHKGVTDVSLTARREELLPYQLLLNRDWAGMVMVGHLFNSGIDKAYPATLSRRTIDDLLRRKLGWQGVVVSDDLQMRAITDQFSLDETIFLAVDAGVDILLFGNNLAWDPALVEKAHSALVRLVKEGRISHDRLRQSWHRIMRLKSVLPQHGAALLPVGAMPLRLGVTMPVQDGKGGCTGGMLTGAADGTSGSGVAGEQGTIPAGVPAGQAYGAGVGTGDGSGTAAVPNVNGTGSTGDNANVGTVGSQNIGADVGGGVMGGSGGVGGGVGVGTGGAGVGVGVGTGGGGVGIGVGGSQGDTGFGVFGGSGGGGIGIGIGVGR